MNPLLEPLSEKVGRQIINPGTINLLDLNKTLITQLFKSEGLILFRNFETNVEIFTQFTNTLSENFLDYTGGVFNRRVINENPTILSVNNFKHEIKLHGEMYYQKNIPLMLWFFCEHPASQGGETVVCDGKLFFDELDQSLKDLFSHKNLKYRGHLDKRDWAKQYKTDDLNTVKAICAENDIYLSVNDDESIDIYYICSAIHQSKYQDYPVFINSLLPVKSMAPNSVLFEDDSEIGSDLMATLNKIAEQTTVEICWQKGDILMIDNTRIMHGRRAFLDDKRDIYLRLCSPSFT